MYNPLETGRRLPFGESGDLEGDYGTYVYRWTLALPQLQGAGLIIGFHVDDIRDLLYIFYDDGALNNRFAIYNLNTQVQIFISPVLVNYTGTVGSNATSSPCANLSAYHCSASRQRYILLVRNDAVTLEVWKDGVQLWTFLMTTINPAILVDLLHMSRRGKWIIVTWSDDVYMFEGV